MARLTGRDGSVVVASVVVHENVYLAGATACGVALSVLRAQSHQVHQTHMSADLSDVTCPRCLAAK